MPFGSFARNSSSWTLRRVGLALETDLNCLELDGALVYLTAGGQRNYFVAFTSQRLWPLPLASLFGNMTGRRSPLRKPLA